ncbi:MAG: hypothetical protein M2R45_02946 [Verrucomicrobia subdivision 3 bacterium]|nr:hypothetical protein [Limisphaerales bacterium]MCS1415334.1 hypothetical protein [Limisphaerales bacterium]
MSRESGTKIYVKLPRVLDASTEFWMSLQKNCELGQMGPRRLRKISPIVA